MQLEVAKAKVLDVCVVVNTIAEIRIFASNNFSLIEKKSPMKRNDDDNITWIPLFLILTL